MMKKMLLTTLLFKFDIHIGAVLVDMKNNNEDKDDGTPLETLTDAQIELMKSNVFPESCTHLSQGVHAFCFDISGLNGTIYCYTAFLSVSNSKSERSFDQYSFVIATRLSFYPLFLRLLDSINFLIDSSNLSPNEIFTLLAEFAFKWGKHLSLITFSKPAGLRNDSYGSSSSSSNSTNSSSDTSNSDSSDYSNNFVSSINSIETSLYSLLSLESLDRSNIIGNIEKKSSSITNLSSSNENEIDVQNSDNKEKTEELDVIQSNQNTTEYPILNSEQTHSETTSILNSDKDFSAIINLNLCLSISTRFELPLFNGVVPINPHPKLTHLLSTQSYFYCANPHFIGFDLITDIEEGFDGALMLWEACITDQPVFVIGSTPRKATNASFSVASLSYPEEPPAFIHPYISVTDKRFSGLMEKPKGIIGVSNPIVENLIGQRSKVIRVGFETNKKEVTQLVKNTKSAKRNSSAHFQTSYLPDASNITRNNQYKEKQGNNYVIGNNKGYSPGAPSSLSMTKNPYPSSLMNMNINDKNQKNNETNLNKNNSLSFSKDDKSESYASVTNSPLPAKIPKMTKSPTMTMSLPNQTLMSNPIQRSQSVQSQMNDFQDLNSAQIRYKLFQNTKRLRKAICEAIDTQISFNILNVLLNNFDLSVIIGRLRANNILCSSPYIEFSSFLIRSKLFKRICKERLSTSSAVNKFLDLDITNLTPESAKKICIGMIHVIQEQNVGKELEKVIKRKLRLIAPIFQQQKQQKESGKTLNTNNDALKNCENEIPSS